MYGLFFDEMDSTTLLGLYSSWGSAEVARQEYIEELVADFDLSKPVSSRTKSYYEECISVRRLEVGGAPSPRYSDGQ